MRTNMDYTPNDTKEDMLTAREKITTIINEYMGEEGYQLSKNSRFAHSLDAFHYLYQNSGGNRDMIKIELNYSLRAHILEPVQRRILPQAFDDGMTIQMLAPMEIFAAKGNALISRAAARDLYDWGNLIAENYSPYSAGKITLCWKEKAASKGKHCKPNAVDRKGA